jgi:hypothetical protein
MFAVARIPLKGHCMGRPLLSGTDMLPFIFQRTRFLYQVVAHRKQLGKIIVDGTAADGMANAVIFGFGDIDGRRNPQLL